MKLALFADIHSNLEAITACIAHAQALGADRYAFLGDLVGYGADPVAVLDLIEQHAADGAVVVLGNHDAAALGRPDDSLSSSAKAAIAWTQNQLGERQRSFLGGLPLTVLIDFGLAHHSHYPDLLAEEFRTPIGNWVYLAPEQALGVRCDPRSHIFAFAAILYQLATGCLPFGKPTSIAQLRRRLYRDPVPPRSLVGQTPAWLQEIILHCLEIDARDRYASAAEVAFDLANPGQVAITERGLRDRRAGWRLLLRRWARARRFDPAPCPPPSIQVRPAPIALVAIGATQDDLTLPEALRDAARRLVATDDQCRIACMTVVPPAAALLGERDEDTATARHIKYLVNLRRRAKPLQLPEERVTYHVLESEKPATVLIDYARMNDVDQILIGAPRSGAPARVFPGVAAQVVAEAPCSVTVVRPRSES